VLPEFPLALVLHFVNVIVGYPVGITVETIVGEVFLLELVIGVEDGLDVVAVFYYVEPGENVSLEVFGSLVFGLVFYVEDWWQVATLELHIVEEMLCLGAG